MTDYNKMISDWEKEKDTHYQLNNEEGDRMVVKCERVILQIREIQKAQERVYYQEEQLETLIIGLTGNTA